MDRRFAVWLLLGVAAWLCGCKPAGPRPLRRDQPHHLVLGAVEGNQASFLVVDLSKSPPAFAPIVTVPDALAEHRGGEPEPIATHAGADLFVLTGRGGDAEVVRVQADGTRTRLRAALRLFSSRLTPRPLRLVDRRFFLITKSEILSTRLDDSRSLLEPLDTSGFDHFASLTGELVSAHDLRVGDPFDWQLMRLQGSGSLLPVGRLAHSLLTDVVAVDGELAEDGLLFVAGNELRSVFVQRGRRVTGPEVSRVIEDLSVTAIAMQANALVLCGHRLLALPVAFDAQTKPRDIETLSCLDLARRGPLWALLQTEPRRLARLETDPAGEVRISASYPLPESGSWRSILR